MKSYIQRQISLHDYLEIGKVLIVYGPRQIGKTTLILQYLDQFSGRYRSYTGDSITVQEIFSSQRLEKLREYVEGLDLLYIDEAQNIPNIGMNLKLIIDAFPNLQIVVTGSSSFELAGQIGEPLMGRNKILNLYPITDLEIRMSEYFFPETHLDYMLRFGNYPEVILENTVEGKITKVKNLAESFLLKDIFKFEQLKKPELLLNLLRSLAYQLGNQVNIDSLSKELGVHNKTIERYLNLLEQSFVIFRLKSWNSNLRTEIRKKSKFYFYDLGIRNAVINDFSETNMQNTSPKRRDIGALFENFLIVEKMKQNGYTNAVYQTFFWRNTNGYEIDYLEKWDQNVRLYEFTITNAAKKRFPKSFVETYDTLHCDFSVITRENYREFLALGR